MLKQIEPNDDILNVWELRNKLISAAQDQYHPDDIDESVVALINTQNYEMACIQADLLLFNAIQRHYGNEVKVKTDSDQLLIYRCVE